MFLVLDSKSSFPSIDIDIGFEMNVCQPEILISNLNEQFRTTLVYSQNNTRVYTTYSKRIEMKGIGLLAPFRDLFAIRHSLSRNFISRFVRLVPGALKTVHGSVSQT